MVTVISQDIFSVEFCIHKEISVSKTNFAQCQECINWNHRETFCVIAIYETSCCAKSGINMEKFKPRKSTSATHTPFGISSLSKFGDDVGTFLHYLCFKGRKRLQLHV